MKYTKNPMLKNWLKNDNRPVSVDVSCTVYNHGPYLREALDGIFMQKTDFPVRVIIHDDASTDNSVSIIQEYEKKYPDKIISIIEKENKYQNGQSLFKIMLPFYTSKYIAYCEGDDYWTDPYKLQKQVDYLENNPDCAAVYHNILPVDEHSQYDESLRLTYKLLKEGDYTKKEIRNFVLKTQTASLVKRNYHPWMSEQDIIFYADAKFNGDEKNLILCGLLGRIHYLPDVMAAHRRVFQGDSWTAMQHKKEKSQKLIEKYNRYIEKCRFYEYFSGRKKYRYNKILEMQFGIIRKFPKNKINICKNVPFYAYLVYIPVFFYNRACACIKKLIRR